MLRGHVVWLHGSRDLSVFDGEAAQAGLKPVHAKVESTGLVFNRI